METLEATGYARFAREVERVVGFPLSAYKARPMQRRIGEWLKSRGHTSYQAYLRALEREAAEREAFRRFLTINTSSFFRDPEVFRFIAGQILPALARAPVLRVWSAGCSIGAEPYSLAMLLLAERGPGRFRILATDIDREALEVARHGRYPLEYLQGIPAEFRRHVEVDTHGFTVGEPVRRAVTFQEGDLLTGTVLPGAFELILCRNVLIYWTPEAQQAVLRRLAAGLAAGGYLILGGAEWIREPHELGLVGVAHSIYRRPGGAGESAAGRATARGG